nr:unnamed protein product [Digitaria exilis]
MELTNLVFKSPVKRDSGFRTSGASRRDASRWPPANPSPNRRGRQGGTKGWPLVGRGREPPLRSPGAGLEEGESREAGVGGGPASGGDPLAEASGRVAVRSR